MIPSGLIKQSIQTFLPPSMNAEAAVVEIGAIGAQESAYATRQQIDGPARSFWMFEPNGIHALMSNASTTWTLETLCKKMDIEFEGNAIYEALGTADGDHLACCMSRLLLWADPYPLALLGDGAGASLTYFRVWRPGAYWNGSAEDQASLESRFLSNYQASMEAFGHA
jgi:hypothetical protein